MSKKHALAVQLIAISMFSVAMTDSASATEIPVWFVGGETTTEALTSQTSGGIELGDPNALGLGVKVAVLCSITADGTVGPGAEDSITEILNSSGEKIELGGKELSCTNVEGCPSATAAPEDLPWSSELTLSGSTTLDVITSDGKGEPGWSVMCTEPLVGLVEETCTGVISSKLENDPVELDVLGSFIKSENNKSSCSGSKENNGFISTENDGASLISSSAGELQVKPIEVLFNPILVKFNGVPATLPLEIIIDNGKLELEAQRVEDAVNYKALDPKKCIKAGAFKNCIVEVQEVNAGVPNTNYRPKFKGIKFEPAVIVEN